MGREDRDREEFEAVVEMYGRALNSDISVQVNKLWQDSGVYVCLQSLYEYMSFNMFGQYRHRAFCVMGRTVPYRYFLLDFAYVEASPLADLQHFAKIDDCIEYAKIFQDVRLVEYLGARKAQLLKTE